MQNFAPIALFVYNRPEHTRRTLKFLQQNLLADESRLFIFSDGPKNQKDHDLVNEVRLLVKNAEGFRSVEVIERKENMGLADTIISGVTQLVKEYGKVIVFEDDLIASSYTLQYFNDALKKYQQQPQVMHIGAYMYPLKDKSLPQTFFSRIATSWGWATWDTAWNNFEPDITTLLAQFDRAKIQDFSFKKAMNYWKQLKGFKTGENNSWAIRWYASMYLKGGLSLNPAQSLVNNIGHDGSGIHSGISTIYDVAINTTTPITFFPDDINEHKAGEDALYHYFKFRKGSVWERIKRYLSQKIR